MPGTRLLYDARHVICAWDKAPRSGEWANGEGDTHMNENRLRMLEACGQSVWLDGISRGQLTSGMLLDLIDHAGLSGVTTSPATFERAITGTSDYDQDIFDDALQGKKAAQILDDLIVTDVQGAADDLRVVWDRTNGRDGYVSVALSPHLARDAEATLAEAHHLWDTINRPNILIAIPGTLEGLPAIRRCLADGLNVNVTTVFSVTRYEAVVRAYFDAVETRLVQGDAVDCLASVASFAVVPVDRLVNQTITEKLQTTHDPVDRKILAGLAGKVGLANAKLAYAHFAQAFATSDDWWDKLAGAGARVQRLLWTGVSTEESGWTDLHDVERLIAPRTVVAMRPPTLEAFRDHGKIGSDTAAEAQDEASQVIQSLVEVGIDWNTLAARLEQDTISDLASTFDRLVAEVARKVQGFQGKTSATRQA